MTGFLNYTDVFLIYDTISSHLISHLVFCGLAVHFFFVTLYIPAPSAAPVANPPTEDTTATLAGSSIKALPPSSWLAKAVEAVCVIVIVDVQLVMFPIMRTLYMCVLLFDSVGSIAPYSKHVTNTL